MNTSGISPSFLGLSRSSGQVTHVLLTRSRLCPRASPGSSLHLHVLSTPPAFVLSQDQTLREVVLLAAGKPTAVTEVRLDCVRHRVHRGDLGQTGQFIPPHPLASVKGQTWTPLGRCEDRVVRMLLSFQRPSRPFGKGTPSQRGPLRRNHPRECGPGTGAPGEPTRKLSRVDPS